MRCWRMDSRGVGCSGRKRSTRMCGCGMRGGRMGGCRRRMRSVHRSWNGRRRGLCLRRLWRFFHRLRLSRALQHMTNFFGYFERNGTRVGLLFGYAETRQKIDDCFCLYFQLASQFIDADLRCVSHTSL